MTTDISAVDTNVLIYLHDVVDINKRTVAEELLAKRPKISNQVLSEYLNVTRRLLKMSKEDLLSDTADLFINCELVLVTHNTIFSSATLAKQYNFQLFDAIIVASALESGCNILYSEDMHHGLLVYNKLQIINPFL